MSKVCINGRLLDASRASVSVFDRGYLFGEGVFDTIRVCNGRPAFLEFHYQRTCAACAAIAIDFPLTLAMYARDVTRTAHANRMRDGVVRVTVSAQGERSHYAPTRVGSARATVVMMTRRLPREISDDGSGDNSDDVPRTARVVIVRTVTRDSLAIAGLKSTSDLSRSLARAEIIAARADEGLICDEAGRILEGTSSNIFLVRRGVLHTPPLSDGIVPGITRFVVLGIAQSLRLKVRETHITRVHLKTAEEVFLSGSGRGITAVREITNIVTWKAVGGVTQQIHSAYQLLLYRDSQR